MEDRLWYLLKTCVSAGNLLLQQELLLITHRTLIKPLYSVEIHSPLLSYAVPVAKLLQLQLLQPGSDRSQNKVATVNYSELWIIAVSKVFPLNLRI